MEIELKTDNISAKMKNKKQLPVDKFEFEPIKGYPMLHWQGKRPFASTQYYPAQLKETHGNAIDGWMNEIYWGDNLQVMSHLLKKYRGKIDLIYIDPPFDSKAYYKKKIEIKKQKVNNDYNSFEEKQYNDIWTNDEYLQFMYERLVLMRELLSDSGSIFVHMNDVRSHYIKIVMDDIFGDENYRNEIILRNINKNLQGQFKQLTSMNRYGDFLLWYSKTPNSKYKKPEKEFFRKGY